MTDVNWQMVIAFNVTVAPQDPGYFQATVLAKGGELAPGESVPMVALARSPERAAAFALQAFAELFKKERGQLQ